MRNPINLLKRAFHTIPCFLEIKTMSQKNKIEVFVNKAFHSWGELISPLQVKREITNLLEIVKKKKPKVILEIGTAKGGTLFLFSRVVPMNATIISIDLRGGEFGGGYSIFRIPLYKSFARKKQKIHLIRGDSHKEETFNKVRKILRGREIDFLFIDGDHTYTGIKKDFKTYSKLVGKEGIMGFHDIAIHPKNSRCNVRKFWKELKNKSKKEIIENRKQGWGGIGVIRKD